MRRLGRGNDMTQKPNISKPDKVSVSAMNNEPNISKPEKVSDQQ